MKLKHLFLTLFAAASLPGFANPVVVKMNAVSKTMTLAAKESGCPVELPDPVNQEYTFELDPGHYVLSAYAADGSTLNGTITLDVKDSSDTQRFEVLTCTAYATNKSADNTSWTMENGDYTLNVAVNTREGEPVEQTLGLGTTPGRYTFLALSGNSYKAVFEPSASHQAEGFMSLYRVGTLTANVSVSGAIPSGGEFCVTVPADAGLSLGMKFTHFTDFTPIEPKSVENADGARKYTYVLANGQVYNYRTWRAGGLTHAGYFTMNTAAPEKCPALAFTDADYAKADPKAVNHSVQSNGGYETGDLLLNINPSHHLQLGVGDEFLLHGMRMWELSDNSTNNYFIEPDFHYTVLGTDFKPTDDVVGIENQLADNTSAWSRLRAKGVGTAIVLVTYDGINLNYYSGADRKEYLGGEYWGAIWPENTGVFVVTVGQAPSAAVPNMTVNEDYNMDALRLAGNNVDAEHDVFYYLDTEEGFCFTFKPEGVVSVDMASPAVTATGVSYAGFSAEGVTSNADGSYTLLLKEGRTIVRMTDAAGNAAYQVLRAKPCHREISNESRPGSAIYQPGDKVKVQYSGLFHPANKIAGIYNMSAYVTYNGTPNGSSLILGSGQYTFGSAASAQAVSVEIPADYNVAANPQWVMDRGVIQVNGFGDPIGNHRNTSPVAGRSPNFTAVAHKTYFGAIPDIRLDLKPVKYFEITLSGAPVGAEVCLSYDGRAVEPGEGGAYSGTYGTYAVTATADGYKCCRKSFTIGDDSDDSVVFDLAMEPLGDAWDGKTRTEPQTDADGTYLIANGAELAWLADRANTAGTALNAMLTADIELGNFDWTPIGTSSKKYTGTFDGAGHSVSEIYIATTTNNQGLFGYVSDATITSLTLSGSVSGKQYVGALAGYAVGNTSIDRCANRCSVNGSGTYVGGLVGYLNSANASLTNCYNAGSVSGTSNCGGVIGNHNANATMTNIFNVGAVDGTAVGACVGGTTAKSKLTNAFATAEYKITTGQTLVTDAQMASGEIAFRLGDAFSQTIGVNAHPVFDGLKVYRDEDADEYYNLATGFEIELGEGDENVEVEDGIVTMHVRDSYLLSVSAVPELARLPEIVWTSDCGDVATVDCGLVSALAKGQAEITATAAFSDGSMSKTCAVNVIGAVVTDLCIGQTEVSLHIKDNPTAVLTATFGPDHADAPRVVWSTDDDKVVAVEHDGSLSATVKAVGEGSATVRVEHADNPDVYDTCLVKVDGVSALSDVYADGVDSVDVFDMAGRAVMLGATAQSCRTLAPGLYVVRYGDTVRQVIVK